MKTITFCFFILLSHFAQAQFKASATRQDWAGGVCCVTGTNYVITLSGQTDSLNNSDFLYAVIDGHRFDINKTADSHPIKLDDRTKYTFHFGVSVNHNSYYDTDDLYNEQLNKEEIFEGTYVFMKINGNEIKVSINPVVELMYLAYP